MFVCGAMGGVRSKPDFAAGLSVKCWELIFSYLDAASQLHLALAHVRLCGIFKAYARRRYRHIDDALLEQLNSTQVEQFLQLIGDSVCSYLKYSSDQDKVEQLHPARFELILRHCKQLEHFGFYQLLVSEALSQLDQLQHLYLRTEARDWRSKLLEGIASTAKLETLVIRGPPLSGKDIMTIGSISSLQELDISCDFLPLEQLLQLQDLQKLHITKETLTTKDLFKLVKGLRKLCVLQLNNCPLITNSFHGCSIETAENKIFGIFVNKTEKFIKCTDITDKTEFKIGD